MDEAFQSAAAAAAAAAVAVSTAFDGTVDAASMAAAAAAGAAAALPELPELPALPVDSRPLPPWPATASCPQFAALFQSHCQEVHARLLAQQWDAVGLVWVKFWTTLPDPARTEALQEAAAKDVETLEKVAYDAFVDALLPDVFRALSSILTKQIRTFAKHTETWMASAMRDFPRSFATARSDNATLFAQKLRRYTSLNHLAQAARAVLKNATHVAQMQTDYSRVDFSNVQEQAAWACEGCDVAVMGRLEEEFRGFLVEGCTLEHWAQWLQRVVRQCLHGHETAPDFQDKAHDLLLRWSFVSSLIIRDLTLRSATSFGMFHLMRLLCDEYMYFLVEKAVGAASCPTLTHIPGGGEELLSRTELENPQDDVFDDDVEDGKRIREEDDFDEDFEEDED
eukprot:m.131942 g.131942  ORF g.131942 m.131942 type:complete len:396 (+) comp20041_c0_seq12:468-1655(+)